MGREIRKVPPGWEHPKDKDEHYRPLYDRTYNEALADWQEYDGADPKGKPGPEYYRPAFAEGEATHYQVYETVTEGTPTSPVFAMLDEVEQWLIGQGHSVKAAHAFCEEGWAPSFIMFTSSSGKRVLISGIDACAYHDAQAKQEDPR